MDQKDSIASAISRGTSNNFDLLRLVAALMVLVSHCYPLRGAPFDQEVFYRWLGQYDNGGAIGVAIFFTISGFLVTRSVMERETGAFVLARVRRILPALISLTLFEVFVIGPIYTSLPRANYFSTYDTWHHLANPMVFGISGGLPGVFLDNPNKGVNGSLWTLPVEATCYLTLPFLLILGALRRPYFWIIVLAVAFLFGGLTYFGYSFFVPLDQILWGVPTYPALKQILFFSVGSAFWIYRDAICLKHSYASLAVISLYAAQIGYLKNVVPFIAVPYLIFYIALRLPVVINLRRSIGDLSYGIYLFAFPVTQAVIVATPGITPLQTAAIVTPIVLVIAAASWHFVEWPALNSRLINPRQGRAPDTVSSPQFPAELRATDPIRAR